MVRIMRFWRPGLSSRTVATPIACVWMALCGVIHFSLPARALNDADQIRALIGKTWDTSESKVETDPVVLSGDFAVASWTQGDRGGRALLRRDAKGWSVVLCSGDPLKDAGRLVEAGVPPSDADRIAKALALSEARAAPGRRARFSLFEGTVSGGDGAHHAPPDHDHHSHP